MRTGKERSLSLTCSDHRHRIIRARKLAKPRDEFSCCSKAVVIAGPVVKRWDHNATAEWILLELLDVVID
jgi:hypothetical protein